jgi:hypothetical protein
MAWAAAAQRAADRLLVGLIKKKPLPKLGGALIAFMRC